MNGELIQCSGAIAEYAAIKYGDHIFTPHFFERLYERIPAPDRSAVIAELHHLVKTGMYKHLFLKKRKNVNILICGKLEIVLSLKGGHLRIKTIFEPNPERKAILKADITGQHPSLIAKTLH